VILNKMAEEKIILRCENCKSRQVYTTKKERICRKCGHRESLNQEDNKENAN